MSAYLGAGRNQDHYLYGEFVPQPGAKPALALSGHLFLAGRVSDSAGSVDSLVLQPRPPLSASSGILSLSSTDELDNAGQQAFCFLLSCIELAQPASFFLFFIFHR